MSMTAAEAAGPTATVDLGSFHFVELPSSDRFLLVADTTEIDIEPDQAYTVTFAIEASNPYVTESITLSRSVSVRSRASVSVTDQIATDDGTLVTVDSATLPDGGFVSIHDRESLKTGDRTGSVLGTSNYLSPGVSSSIRVRLDRHISQATEIVAMAHNDTDDNRQYGFVATGGTADTPYEHDGSPVADNATVRVPTTTRTPTPTPIPTPRQRPQPRRPRPH